MSRYLLPDGRRVDGAALVVIDPKDTRTCDSLSTAEKTALNVKQITEVIPVIDPATEVMEGPTVSPDGLTETYTKRPKTAQELDTDRTARASDLKVFDLLTVILNLENDNRIIKAKINTLIADANTITAKFTTGQVTQISMNQLINALKALLQ